MKLSSVYKFMNNDISVESFKKQIKNEVEEYQRSFSIRGNSSPIYLDEDTEEINVNRSNVLLLCDLYLDRTINNFEFNYLIEALLLSEKTTFESEIVRTALEDLSDSEYGLNLTKEYVNDVLSSMK